MKGKINDEYNLSTLFFSSFFCKILKLNCLYRRIITKTNTNILFHICSIRYSVSTVYRGINCVTKSFSKPLGALTANAFLKAVKLS